MPHDNRPDAPLVRNRPTYIIVFHDVDVPMIPLETKVKAKALKETVIANHKRRATQNGLNSLDPRATTGKLPQGQA